MSPRTPETAPRRGLTRTGNVTAARGPKVLIDSSREYACSSAAGFHDFLATVRVVVQPSSLVEPSLSSVPLHLIPQGIRLYTDSKHIE